MATKPVLPTFEWATDTLYTTGPAALIGTATKILPPLAESDEGWKADQKPPAQWANYKDNWLVLLGEWVRLGSNTADIDPHIVEAGADGVVRIAGGYFGGTAQAEASVIDITPNTTGGGDSRGMLITMVDTVGIEMSAADASCIVADSDSNTSPTIDITQQGGEPAARFRTQGASAGTPVVSVEATTVGTDGLFIDTTGANRYTLRCEGVDTGNSLIELVRPGGGTPRHGAILFPEHATPNSVGTGELWKGPGTASLQRGYFKYYDTAGASGGGGAGEQTVWSSEGGVGAAFETEAGPDTTTSGSYTTEATLVLDGTGVNQPEGTYLVTFTAAVETANTASRASVRMGSTVDNIDYEIDFAATNRRKTVTRQMVVNYTGTTITFNIEFRSIGGDTITIRDSVITAIGAYEG